MGTAGFRVKVYYIFQGVCAVPHIVAKWPNLFKKSNFRDIKLKFSPEVDFNHRN